MVFIPDGSYVAGKWLAFDDSGLAGERTEQQLAVGGFWIDRYELHAIPKVIGADESEATAATKQAWNTSYAWEVDNNRTWRESRALCKRQGKRICTEDEWEKACRGPESHTYAYGDVYEPKRCPPSGYGPPPYKANQHPACKSGFGVYGLSGGIAEWTSSKRGTSYIVKPGEVGSDSESTRCAGRFDRSPNFAQIHVGVRCCAD
jgi:formylglycine-generating enzyme required for sulfatase activity